VLELNAEWKIPKLLLSWTPMRQGQIFGDNPGNGKPNTAVGKRTFPDLPVLPDFGSGQKVGDKGSVGVCTNGS